MIPVCYCSNSKIFHGIVLSVLSILKHTKDSICVYLLTMDLTHINEKFKPISEEQAKALDEIVKEYNPENKVILLDGTKQFLAEFSKSKNIKTGYTPYTIERLILDMTDVPSKLIYLDVDTMCCSDIGQLYNEDVEGWEVAMVTDVMGHFWVRRDYCNAGVLLLNLDEIKKTGLFVKARERVRKRKMIMPDQSAINFLATKKKRLPYKYNEQRAIKEDTVIKHFCQGMKWYGPFFKIFNYKQWDRKSVHEKLKIHDFDDIYEIYDEYDKKYDFENKRGAELKSGELTGAELKSGNNG